MVCLKKKSWHSVIHFFKGGEAIQFNVLQAPAIVIHSRELIKELLEKRAHIYSDRSKLVSILLVVLEDLIVIIEDHGRRIVSSKNVLAPHLFQF